MNNEPTSLRLYRFFFCAVLLILAHSCAHAQLARAYGPSVTQSAFDWVCERTTLECEFDAPYLLMMNTGESIMGTYIHGTNVVILTSKCIDFMTDQVRCDAIVVHEIMHYILYQNNVLTSKEDKCRNESAAFYIYNAYVVAVGRPELVATNWQRGYGCEEPK